MHSRLEDRIRELCARIVAAPDSPESLKAVKELRAALHGHNARLRKRLLFPIPPDRRSDPSDESAA